MYQAICIYRRPAPAMYPQLTAQTLAERLNFADAPRPFKNPHFISRLGQRTATSSTTGVKKNAKQILVLERERVSGGDGFLSAAQVLQKARGEPIDIGKKRKGLPGGSGGGNSGSFGHGGNKKGSGGMQNVLKGRMKKALAAAAAESAGRGEGVPPMLMSQGAAGGSGTGGEGNGTETGLTTPGTSFAAAGGESGMTSGMVTPRNGDGDLNGQWQGEEGEEDVTMDNVNGIVHGNGEVGGVQVEGYVTEADIMPKGEVFTCTSISTYLVNTLSQVVEKRFLSN